MQKKGVVMLDITGKWTLLTGASRGVGREVAIALAEKGSNLILHSRDMSHTAQLAKQLAVLEVEVFQLSANLRDIQQVHYLAQRAEELSGGIDILYNNAAVMTPYRDDFYQTPEEDFLTSFAVNTIAPITLCNLIIPKMIQRGFGRVVNVTSGIRDEPQLMAYAISKAALDKYVSDMTKSLARTGVLLNLLDPGWLRTDLGGPKAPNTVETVIPGALVPVLQDDGTCGHLFQAQRYREG